jgi:hypothetical protein
MLFFEHHEYGTKNSAGTHRCRTLTAPRRHQVRCEANEFTSHLTWGKEATPIDETSAAHKAVSLHSA